MIVAEPLGSAQDKSLELELGRNTHNLARGGAAFRQPKSGDGETSAENSRQFASPGIKNFDGRN